MTSVLDTVGGTRGLAARLRHPDNMLIPVALLFALVLGRSLVNGRMAFAALVAGLVLVVALAQAAWLPYAASVAVVATFAEQAAMPQFGLPGSPLLSDLILLGAFGAWLLILARPGAVGPGSFPLAPQLAIAALITGGLLGIFVGVTNGIAPTEAVRYARDIAFYAAFWFALTAFADVRARLLVLKLGAGVAVAIVTAQIAQGVLGAGHVIFFVQDPFRELIGGCGEAVCAGANPAGFPRVRPPGLALVYVAACFSSAYLLWGPPRRRALVSCVLAVCAGGILVSQNRNMLIGLAAGVLFAGLLGRHRGRVAATLAIASLAVLVMLAVARGSPALRESTVVGRVLSLTAVSQLESSSTVTDRLRENSFALKALSASPVEGLGWAVPFGLADTRWQDGELRTEDQLFVHNQYLLVWLRAGLLGLVGLLAALVLSVIYGARWLRGREEEEAAWLGAAVVVSATAMAISSLVGIYIVNPSSAPILAGVVALAAVLQRDLMRAT
jgi:hypothetical protein